MYKTVWYVCGEKTTKEITYYHFGKELKFPTKILDGACAYVVELDINLKLVPCLETFMKCLRHKVKIIETENSK